MARCGCASSQFLTGDCGLETGDHGLETGERDLEKLPAGDRGLEKLSAGIVSPIVASAEPAARGIPDT